MNIFIAGGSGAIGRQLVPMLVNEGHHVVAMTRSPEGAARLAAMGATPVTGNVFDQAHLCKLMMDAAPDMVIHQLTAFGAKDADPLAETIRVRTVGTFNLMDAAKAAKVKRVITQSISFICSPAGDGLTTEETPLYLEAIDAIRPLAEAVAEMERLTLHTDGIDGVVLRYGWFYGAGTNFDPVDTIPRAILKGRMPIVGGGNGMYSFVHVQDAAIATMKALTEAASGIYNIVDDHPAKLNEWLPFVAKLLNAPTPAHMDEGLAREKLGDMLVYIFNEQKGASNLKAKKALNWQPAISSWQVGFKNLYAAS